MSCASFCIIIPESTSLLGLYVVPVFDCRIDDLWNESVADWPLSHSRPQKKMKRKRSWTKNRWRTITTWRRMASINCFPQIGNDQWRCKIIYCLLVIIPFPPRTRSLFSQLELCGIAIAIYLSLSLSLHGSGQIWNQSDQTRPDPVHRRRIITSQPTTSGKGTNERDFDGWSCNMSGAYH